MKKRIFLLAFVSLLLLMMLVAYALNVLAWSNGGYSADPSNPDYGTHDWIAEHALDWLPEEEKRYIVDNLAACLYGTELPDNPAGIGDTAKHHIYYWSNGSLHDDTSAVRAYEEYNNTLSFLKLGDLANASKTAGIMSHYIVDVAVFGHVMGAGTDWGAEVHHSDYETYVNQRTSSYSAEFNLYLSFDGALDLISAYDAAKELAYDTTFDVDGDLTCLWMDQNYNWNDPVFKNRCGESLNLAVNYLADVLHTLYLEAASVHNIDTGLDYLTIQEAINAPETLDGHTILVDAGIYYEHVFINKSISLIGENRSTTIIDGNETETVITITASNVNISGFTIQNGLTAIHIHSSSNVGIRNNTLIYHGVGVSLVSSNDNVIVNNEMRWSGWGLETWGIELFYSKRNVIVENTVRNNYIGVNLISSPDNVLYHNNLVDNQYQANAVSLNGGEANIWDNGVEGNYWSDYNGTDDNQDGIGDSPYLIDADNQDNYPLMGMFSDFLVALGEETYHVTTVCNSTISAFEFDQVNRIISFNVTGEEGIGFCRVCIPHDLMEPLYTVTVDGHPPQYVNYTLYDNGTHTWIYFTYQHSTHKIEIIPEFPSWTSTLLMLIVFTVAIVICKRRLFCCS